MFNVKKIDIDADHDLIALLLEDDANQLALTAGERIKITNPQTQNYIICELDIVENHQKNNCPLKEGELGLFEHAFEKLKLWKVKKVNLIPANKPLSLKYVKKKFEGKKLNGQEYFEIIQDIVENRYSEIETTYFVIASTVNKLDDDETVYLTKAMINVGKELNFKTKSSDIIVDKHCIGGVPNNRTTLLVVPIVAAAGLIIPKTSSRSITSPAGTADVMEVLSNVELSLTEMYNIVEKNNGCIIWGGALELSPADDIIINVEHPLEIDSEEQMIASILSKKKSAGSTHVLIDIPIGRTAKISSKEEAEKLAIRFLNVGKRVGLTIRCIITDGSQPIGNGIGPLYEAIDILNILEQKDKIAYDLREKALVMAGQIFEISKHVKEGQGYFLAKEILESGKALEKFNEILESQGKKLLPPKARYSVLIKSKKNGKIIELDNKLISKLAFILGAPEDQCAGLKLFKKKKQVVQKNDPLYEIYSNSKLKLDYALHFIEENNLYLIK